MGVNINRVRSLFESRVRANPRRGRVRFVNEVRHALGLCDPQGNDYRDRYGNRRLAEQRTLVPEAFSVLELAQGIIGPRWVDHFDPSNAGRHARLMAASSLMMEQRGRQSVLEAAGVGIDPTSFLNVNTFTQVVGGLVEVKILEAFQNPSFIGDQLMPTEPTRVNGQKVIGTTRIGDKSKKRAIGNPHERAQFSERWVQTPELRENALAVDVYKETVFFDLTGDILQQGAAVGDEIGYRRELEIIDCYIGVTSTFNYMGIGSLPTYATGSVPAGLTGLSGWFNNSQSNELLDWQNYQTAMLLFSRQVDPHTGKRILINPNVILVNPGKVALANLIFDARETEVRSAGAATQATASQLFISRTPGTPYGKPTVLTSPLVEQRCTDADGLNLSVANATKRWWAGERGKAFRYMQHWPLTVVPAPPNQYEMIDRGIVATWFANERGIPSVWSPWHVQANTH